MDDSEKFFLLKIAEQDLTNAKSALQRILTSKPMSLNFNLCKEITNCFTDLSALGSFYEPIPCKIFSVQDKNEKYRCSITGMCQLEDGCLVLADVANNSIKKLGPSYTVVDRCKLSSQPWSVCTFGNKEVAVSLCDKKAIQFVMVAGKMQMSRSFRVKDACAGLASSRNSLIVGFYNRKQIQIYDHSGFPLQMIDLACGNNSYVPWSIAITPNRKLLYVATQENGVVSVDTKEKTCRKLDIPSLKFALSVALSDDGSLLISCKESNKIIRYINGKTDVLLSEADGIASPQSLCCYQQELVVAAGMSDAVRVYSHI